MATIKDVAKLAGVSISTVSYALNNTGYVSTEKKEKVLKAAMKLNYRPDSNAKNLKSKKKNLIGLILSELHGPFYSEFIKGVQEEVLSYEYDLVSISSSGGLKSTAVRFLKENRTDGMIVFDHHMYEDLIKNAADANMPIVLINQHIKHKYVMSVMVDNIAASYDAVEYIISQGYKKIGYLGGFPLSYADKKRFKGYCDALNDHKIEYIPQFYYQGNFTKEGGYKAAKLMILQNKIPDALFSANDEMAIGAMQAFHESKIIVGKDIGIVGFDDIELAQYVNPSLTTVRQSMYEMGILATKSIFNAMNGQFQEEPIMMKTELIIRESCKKQIE
ncbi:LacI family transcriptional regulator [Vallitalea longa]|uniref:LacI family transcriptional regulator n=1 Tax=Vallitalea longa TaxID=2936439 RepID=A0A9W5YA34_9FIRM|nr:LacI family DNA-binding transcriptional regulator [Vallitalea longa]GKX28911.1 LacI family transcriptional regulator [Vallitalea longa]